MTERVDVKINTRVDGSYGMAYNAQGDFETTPGFDTALLMSLLCERRASSDEVVDSRLRRGWVGNEDQDNPIGSKVWLADQARRTSDTLNDLKTYAEGGLEWFLSEGLVDDFTVEPTFTAQGAAVEINFIIDNEATRFLINLWRNTGAA